MLKARWSGYEIDSSEAAYNVRVREPAEIGTLVRAFLSSGYFVRSFYLLGEAQMLRLKEWVEQREPPEAKIHQALDSVIAKFNDTRWSRIGVRNLQTILNYVGHHTRELLDDQLFRFEPTEEQRELYEDSDVEFEPGSFVDEEMFYSDYEIPMDGVVMALGCQLVKAGNLSAAEQRKARQMVRRAGRQMDQFETTLFGESWADLLSSGLDATMSISLRVRLNPDATLSVAGRWMEDGQFLLEYYSYLLEQAAVKAEVEIGFYMAS